MQRIKWKAVPREMGWLLGAVVVVLACIWPIRSLQKLSQQNVSLSQQRMDIQTLVQEAVLLKNQVQPRENQTPSALLQTWAQEHLGEQGSVVVAGDSATVTIKGLPYTQLAEVFAALRQEVGAHVQEVQLRQTDAALSGRLQLSLPGGR